MRVAFAINTRDKSIIPGLISFMTRSPAYHCELVFSDSKAISAQRDGVQIIDRQYDWFGWTALPIPWIDWQAEKGIRAQAELIADHCLGRGASAYDYFGALFGRLNARWEIPAKWYCSELVSYLLFPYTPVLNEHKWYSPGMLWETLSNYLNVIEPKYMNICAFRYCSPKKSKSSKKIDEVESPDSEAEISGS